MIIDKINSHDFDRKLRNNLFTTRYSRHPSGRRLGFASSTVRGNQSKIKVCYWNFKKAEWTQEASVILSDLDFSIPEGGYFTKANGELTYVDFVKMQRNRWNYGLYYPNVKPRLDIASTLRLYGIYKPIRNTDIITPDIAIRDHYVYFRDTFVIGNLIDTTIVLHEQAKDTFNERELQEIYNVNS